MGHLAANPQRRRGVRTPAAEPDTRYDRRQGEVLRAATEVFCDKGYAAASMRDLARESGMSLAGLYHYVESKEKLLYLIQKQTFSTILTQARERLAAVTDREERIRIFIQNHLEYFLEHKKAMKVLSHEGEALQSGYRDEVKALKREYYRLCISLVEELRRERHAEATVGGSSRIAVLSLFGMMNWIYTWHNPRTDADAHALAQKMGDLFLCGLLGETGRRRPRNGSKHPRQD